MTEDTPQQPVTTLSATTVPTSSLRRRLHTIRIFTLRIFLLLLFLWGAFLTLFPTGRAVTRSIQLLPEILTASQQPPFSWSSEPIAHTEMTTTSAGGTINLDIYAPTTPSPLIASVRSGLLVISGVGDNRQEPQLVNLLEAFAHTGIVVMNLTTPILSSYTLSPLDTDSVVQAFKTLAQLPNMQGKAIGMISISAGVTLASLAAADPRIRDNIAYLVAFGGSFNVKSLLRTIGRRAQTLDGKTEPWQPIDIPLQVLANTTAQYFTPTERSLLVNAFAPGAAPLTTDQLAQLSPDALAIYRLLSGTDPNNVDANLAHLSPAMQARLDQLSASSAVAAIHAPVFLLHDRDDPSLPVSETRAYASALANLHHSYRYVELHIFDHVRVRTDLNDFQLLGDGWQLFSLLIDIIARNS